MNKQHLSPIYTSRSLSVCCM